MVSQEIKSRILIVSSYTWPDLSGSGIHALRFAKFLLKQGNSTMLLSFNRNLRYARKEQIDMVPVKRLAYFNRNILLKLLSLILILPGYLVHIIRSDVIVIYGSRIIAYQFLILAAKTFSRKVVFRSLLLGVDDMETLCARRAKFGRTVNKRIFRTIDVYFAINQAFADMFLRHVGSGPRLLVSPQGTDTDEFRPGLNPPVDNHINLTGLDSGAFRILSVGFLVPRKGYEEVFRVLEQLEENFVYMIAGEYEFTGGHFLGGLAKEAYSIRKVGFELLGDKLILLGRNDDMPAVYNLADLVIINSYKEGLSNTLIEAMSCGRAVLTRKIPGVEQLVEHEVTGLVFSSDGELFELISRLMDDPSLCRKLGQNARKKIVSDARFEVVWERLRHILF